MNLRFFVDLTSISIPSKPPFSAINKMVNFDDGNVEGS